jgi:hypothetical protein
MGDNNVCLDAVKWVTMPDGRQEDLVETVDLWDGPRSKETVWVIMASPDKRKACADWLAANAAEPEAALAALDKFFTDHPASEGWVIKCNAY